ncbi:hypothetical protein U5922_002425 [Aquicoccus sp. G2-2]|uniref:hypothetical protein n=1 Tax=Aquicoccus sp. G2-2 TaxID=3092120 RepID=UPI002AE04C82|nr:hypothetical protein [Aquicoccus sp. G2-2]MEA1112377.1 hypothetical protein [Aquicoccus sp. G2-2]
MSLLLKIKRASLNGNSADVPHAKSTRLEKVDEDSNIYVWFANEGSSRSALAFRTRLTEFQEIEMPQVRNPEKFKRGYRLSLSPEREKPAKTLQTDDLEEVRYSDGTSGFEKLGKLHRDRNDKVIRLTPVEADFLSRQFEGN